MDLRRLTPFVVTFVIVIVAISIGSQVLLEVEDTTLTTQSTYISNESGWLNSSANYYQLTGTGSSIDNENWNIVYIVNVTSNTGIDSANYTVNGSGAVFNATANGVPYNRVNITYTYDSTLQDLQYNATNNGLEGTDNISSWLPTIGLVLGAAVVIGVLLTYFNRGI